MTLSRWATPYVVQPYQARAGHAVVELAVDRFPDVAVELVDRVALRVDAETERALAENPPSSSSSVTSNMISVPDIGHSVRPCSRPADSREIGSRPNLLHAGPSVETISCRPASLREFARQRRESGKNPGVPDARSSRRAPTAHCPARRPARSRSATLVAPGTGDSGRRPCRGQPQAGSVTGPPARILSSVWSAMRRAKSRSREVGQWPSQRRSPRSHPGAGHG